MLGNIVAGVARLLRAVGSISSGAGYGRARSTWTTRNDCGLLIERELLAAEYARLRRQKRRSKEVGKRLSLVTHEALRK